MEELEREVFRVASQEPALHQRAGRWIEAQDLAVPGLIHIAEGQPLRLKLIGAILQAAGDPDRDFRASGGHPGAATTNSTRLRAAGEVAAREHPIKASASVGPELWIHERPPRLC